MKNADIFLLVSVRQAIDAVHSALGAPGDHGYSTPAGAALFELYKQRAALQDAIEVAEQADPSPYSPQPKGRAERVELQRALARQAVRGLSPEALRAAVRQQVVDRCSGAGLGETVHSGAVDNPAEQIPIMGEQAGVVHEQTHQQFDHEIAAELVADRGQLFKVGSVGHGIEQWRESPPNSTGGRA